jgi:hypothetical protein
MVLKSFFRKTWNIKIKLVPLSKVLMGGENDLPGYKYSLLTGDYKRPSILAKDGPHASFIQAYQLQGYHALGKISFETSAYFINARNCIDLFGDYFPSIDSEEKIVLAAERFALLFEDKDVSHLPSEGHSKESELVQLAPIQDSDCYQIVQGNHRIAFAIAKGEQFIKAKILCDQPQVTPVQFLLQNLQWENGSKVLYQPLPCPELELNWRLARKCADRLDKMRSFLTEINLTPSQNISFIDLGSYYGWFVSQFLKLGFSAEGVEKDNIPIQVGKIVYGNLNNSIHHNEIVRFLAKSERQYDVVSCLSIMHHFIYGRERGNPINLLNLLDKSTSRVMFFEMGEDHEQWFSTLLNGWNSEKIENWILSNSSFTNCIHLGRDEDGVGDFYGNFGRMLFAFTK